VFTQTQGFTLGYLSGCPFRAQEHQVKGFASQSRRLRVNGFITRLTFVCNAVVNRCKPVSPPSRPHSCSPAAWARDS